MESDALPGRTGRRHFLAGAAVVVLAAAAKLVPVVSGLQVFLQPLRRHAGPASFVPVTSVSALPADGAPRRFPVVAERVNAWSRTPGVSVGAVYLRRLPNGGVQGFNALCPHAGCPVSFQPERRAFACPCHASRFEVNGAVSSPDSPSPRGLDELEVQVNPAGQVLVKFQNFRSGVAQKVPIG